MLPRLSSAYGDTPKGWEPRPGDGNWIARCQGCGAEYLDDIPCGEPLLSPCCVAQHLKRMVRATLPLDRGNPIQRFGWTVP